WSIDLYERHYVELDPECPVRGHSGEVFSAAFSPDGKRVVSGAWDGTVKILDAATGVEVRSIDAHVDYQVATVDFSPDGRRIVSGSPSENRVKIWDAESGEMLWSITGRKGAFVDCLPDPLKSSYHFLTARDEELLVFERSFQEEENERSFQEGEKAPVASFMAPGEVTCVEVRGSAILLGCMDGSVVLLRAPFLSA
ncbi:WD40-repeat-containing domain protein, partial [Baffinella frigidus]